MGMSDTEGGQSQNVTYPLDPLLRLLVVFGKFLDEVWTDVRVQLLSLLR